MMSPQAIVASADTPVEPEWMLAALGALLHRYRGDNDIWIAYGPLAARAPVRVDCAGDPSFRELVDRVRAELATSEDAANGRAGELIHAAFRTASAPLHDAGSPFHLTLIEGRDGDRAALALESASDGFLPVPTERAAGHLAALLLSAQRDPAQPISRLNLLSRAEREELARWNATEMTYRDDVTVVDLFRDRAHRSPGAIAVDCNGAQLTYAQLDDRAARLASHLRALGVGPEVRVAIALERSIDMVVAVLAVHRAAGAYVPIDADYPAERIGFMLDDSGCAVVVTEEAVRGRLPEHAARVVSLDGDRAAIAGSAPDDGAAEAGPHHLAYLIYTSGSTGRPKGVQVEHGNLVNFLAALPSVVAIGETSRLLAVAPLSFDISGFDLYAPLTSGARVVVASRESAVNPMALIALIERTAPTHMQATPATWRMLVEAGWRGQPGMEVLSIGEAMPPQLAEQLLTRADAVWNLYGPTEATIWATFDRVLRDEPISIGRPLPNYTTYVVDPVGQPVPAGVPGELCIGGKSVARGYLNRAELTAERFVADPFQPANGARMYRTGDIARFRADGKIDFLGRADFQIKLRGYRIELGEIESALEDVSDIRAAVATVRPDAGGAQVLVAYVTTDRPYQFSSLAVRRALAQRLPAYMVPDAVIALDSLPLNVNGKVDRSKLPVPLRNAADQRVPVAPPRSELEAELTTIWEDVLGVRPIGRTDDFFELGVSSIVAAQLFHRIERDLATKLPLSPLFQAPTIEKLAALIESNVSARTAASLVPIQPEGAKTPLFCVHGGAGTILQFQPIAKHLGPTQPFYGFQMRGLYGDGVPALSVEGMARQYLRELRAVQPAGPYALAGYCFGGMVAYEMALQLERNGERVALLAIFNGVTPAYIKQFGADVRLPRLSAPRQPIAQRMRAALAQFTVRGVRGRIAARRRFGDLRDRVSFMLGRAVPAERRERAFLKVAEVAERRYRPGRFTGPILVVQGDGLFHQPELGWREIASGELEVLDVPGKHVTERDALREPQVALVAACVREALERRLPDAQPAEAGS